MKNFANDILEKTSRFGRYIKKSQSDEIKYKSKQLRDRGFVILDHLVETKEFSFAINKLKNEIEKKLNFEVPCLAQNKVSTVKDKDLIQKNFLCSADELRKRNLTFNLDDIVNYKQMLSEFNPPTLTIPMLPHKEYFDIWLDEFVIKIIEEYMGFSPQLIEAYIRRNFPSKFSIMNHNWHRDRNHKHFLLKAFIFFTDCDLDTGAHHYIAGSAQSKDFQHKPYFTDEEINKVWPISSKDRMVSKVKAGTIIIEDTRGLHKAGIPNKKFRDLGYAVFLPPNFFRRLKKYYSIPKIVYDELSLKQKLYIPSQNIN